MNPISIGANHYFLHSNFYLHKELVQLTKLYLITQLFSSIQLLLKHVKYIFFREFLYVLRLWKMDTEDEIFRYRI